VTLSALMAGYAAGRTREALAAFQQLERQQQCQGLRPDTTAFCGLMAVYKEAGRADDAEKTFRRMIAGRGPAQHGGLQLPHPCLWARGAPGGRREGV